MLFPCYYICNVLKHFLILAHIVCLPALQVISVSCQSRPGLLSCLPETKTSSCCQMTDNHLFRQQGHNIPQPRIRPPPPPPTPQRIRQHPPVHILLTIPDPIIPTQRINRRGNQLYPATRKLRRRLLWAQSGRNRLRQRLMGIPTRRNRAMCTRRSSPSHDHGPGRQRQRDRAARNSLVK